MKKCKWCSNKAELIDYRCINQTIIKINSCHKCKFLDTNFLIKKHKDETIFNIQ